VNVNRRTGRLFNSCATAYFGEIFDQNAHWTVCDIGVTPLAPNRPECNKTFAFGATIKAHGAIRWREWIYVGALL